MRRRSQSTLSRLAIEINVGLQHALGVGGELPLRAGVQIAREEIRIALAVADEN